MGGGKDTITDIKKISTVAKQIYVMDNFENKLK